MRPCGHLHVRVTLFFVAGLCVVFFSVFIIVATLPDSLGGGGGVFGAVLGPVVLVVFGIVLMVVGMRPKRYSKHR
jgi:hypothetical protein